MFARCGNGFGGHPRKCAYARTTEGAQLLRIDRQTTLTASKAGLQIRGTCRTVLHWQGCGRKIGDAVVEESEANGEKPLLANLGSVNRRSFQDRPIGVNSIGFLSCRGSYSH